jgi:predicted ATPase
MLDGFERAKAGRGQVFSILSEAGVGKSRLLYEFRKVISNDDVNFFEGKCLSYNRGVAYHPIIDFFKSSFDIRGGDGDSEITLKVKKSLKSLGIDQASTLPYLLELLSVKDSGIEQIPMSSEARKERMIETVIRVPLKGSEKKPLVMAIEDIHWIDRSSEDVLKSLIERISGAKILLIFTYRPEFMPTWGGKSYHNQLNLNPLSNRQSLVMANHLLGTEDIDRGLEELILNKTEGVPFFIEEFLKSFKDLKFIERKDKTYHLKEHPQALTIPSTIQDVLTARIDSLPEKSKGVLQAGSVIGREFDYKLIAEAINLPEQELLSSLSILMYAELLYERGIHPQNTFVFKHALTRDTIYQSLIKSTRQRYHGTIAQVLEERFPKTAEFQPELLSFHWSEAGLADKAIPYWQKAGEIAIRRSAYIEAIGHLKRGLELLKALPGSSTPERIKQEIALQIALGNALIATKGYADPKVGKTFNRARFLL